MKQKKQARHFSPEFKKDLVDKINRGDISAADAAAEHDIRGTMISRWKREAREGELDKAVDNAPRVQQLGVDPKYVRHLEQKLREANERLGELYIVVEGLKKVRADLGYTKNASSLIVTGMSSVPLKRRVG